MAQSSFSNHLYVIILTTYFILLSTDITGAITLTLQNHNTTLPTPDITNIKTVTPPDNNTILETPTQLEDLQQHSSTTTFNQTQKSPEPNLPADEITFHSEGLTSTSGPSEGTTSTKQGPLSTPSPTNGSTIKPIIDVGHNMTYEYLYKEGVKRYLDDNWDECISYFELAVKDRHWYMTTLTSCRRGCKTEAESAEPLSSSRDNTQVYYETIVRSALCLLKCRKQNFPPARMNQATPHDLERDFEMMKPYDYLQLCYFKVGRFQDAANAAVTVLAAQPDHQVMVNNVKQYVDNYSVDMDDMHNLELKDYGVKYMEGDRAHEAGDYATSVRLMEESVSLYWKAHEDCRLLCEEPFDQGWFPDFISSVANHFTFTFRCKRRCPAKLANLFGEEIPHFLASIFNYLQFGYHKLNKHKLACEAVETSLELAPTDAAMLRNKQYYTTEVGNSTQYFKPRKEVTAYAALQRYEDALLNFIDTEFVFLEDEKNVDASDLTSAKNGSSTSLPEGDLLDAPDPVTPLEGTQISQLLKNFFKWDIRADGALPDRKGEL